MCHLCSINHFVDDEFEHDEPSQHECMSKSSPQTDEPDGDRPLFYPVSVGSSF
ncbi:MAG: hypothetical protein Q3971_04375 [Moraxella sp.]|nr:hypothetical protein [Moraxella sp.]